MPEIRCRHRLPSPEMAGYADTVDRETGEVLRTAWENLKNAAVKYPHLRPCPRVDWHWIEKKSCEGCREAVKKNEE